MEIKKKNDFTLNFTLLFLLHYLTASLISSQRSTFLIRLGYTITQRSLIFSIIPFVTITLQFIIGYLSDKYKTIKKLFVIVTIISMISGYLFYSFDSLLFVFHLSMTVISNTAIAIMHDLSDVWVLESKGNSKNNYSFIRAFGSLGWSLGSVLLAKIVASFGYIGLARFAILFNFVILLIVYFIIDDKAEHKIENSTANINLKEIIEIFKNKHYVLAIFIMFLVNFAANTSGYILVDKMLFLNGDESAIGLRIMIQAGVEIPTLLIGRHIYQKLGSFKMITIGAIVYTIQFLGFYLAKSNTTIYLITILQSISLPFFTIAIKHLLFDLSPDHLKTTGQIYGPAIVNGLQGIIYPMITAFLVTKYNINAPLLLATSFTFLATIAALQLKKFT